MDRQAWGSDRQGQALAGEWPDRADAMRIRGLQSLRIAAKHGVNINRESILLHSNSPYPWVTNLTSRLTQRERLCAGRPRAARPKSLLPASATRLPAFAKRPTRGSTGRTVAD